MKTKLFAFVCALLALNAFAHTNNNADPISDFIALEIERLELEVELFGTPTNGEEIIAVEDVVLYELEEEVTIGFDTASKLPKDFNAREGMDLDWSSIELYEVEEDDDIDFDTTKYLPKGFNPYRGLPCDNTVVVGFNF